MREILDNPARIRRIEFWTVTTIFIFAVFFLTTTASSPTQGSFEDAGISFNYYRNYFIPQLIRYSILYGGFVLLNFQVAPRLIRQEALWPNIGFIVLIFLLAGLAFGTTDTYLKNYLFQEYDSEQETYNIIFQNSFLYAFWLLFMVGFYSVIKYSALYLLAHSEALQSKYRVITRDGLVAFVLWMVSMFLLLIGDSNVELIIGWGLIAPCGILFYCYSFYALLPQAFRQPKPFRAYFLRAALFLVLAVFPVAFMVLLLHQPGNYAIALSLLNTGVHLVVTLPLTWLVYKRQLRGNTEIAVLKNELGQSNANLDFLRSQINPHFLFNALNTLYGTALQENSERTAQGIQMLGDMMRFMLHENHQQKILLAREIEYLRNYIELQSLRTSTSPDIVIQTKIEEVLAEKWIAPMLLIPFVENAFKHGISLKEKSWIRVTLHYGQDKLYFDVYNSTHPRPDQDPEKDNSGIGLENVKQRLALQYPGRHELIIRETLEEYFVHLTLQL
jgi:two-component system, LytTR family, sensor kinase